MAVCIVCGDSADMLTEMCEGCRRQNNAEADKSAAQRGTDGDLKTRVEKWLAADEDDRAENEAYLIQNLLALVKTLEAERDKVRAEVFAEIHHHWEFRAKDESDFDQWLHENIKAAEGKTR